MYGREMFNNGGCFGNGFMGSGWHWLIGIGILLIIIAVTYLLVKKGKKSTPSGNALETLKMKFAQGEITEEEYNQRKKVLENNK